MEQIILDMAFRQVTGHQGGTGDFRGSSLMNWGCSTGARIFQPQTGRTEKEAGIF